MVDQQILAHLMDRQRLYCIECHEPKEAEQVTVERPVSRGAVVVDLPARRCPTCGHVYVDVRLGALVEELTVGRIGRVTMAEILAGGSATGG